MCFSSINFLLESGLGLPFKHNQGVAGHFPRKSVSGVKDDAITHNQRRLTTANRPSAGFSAVHRHKRVRRI
jgi:hypothetical protein